jgi:folate-binding protein YgfZ
MALVSPLRALHQQAEASFTPYGPTLVERQGEHPVPVDIVETFGELEIEYAAIRKSCAVFDQPHRGVVEVSGPDRLEFLNRMLTQELKDLAPFSMKRSFWLSRKGRIDADLRVIDLPHATYLEMDVHAVARTVESLSGYVVMEDVRVRDISPEVHRLALHGPTAPELTHALSLSPTGAQGSGPGVRDLPAGRVAVVHIAGAECVVIRDDTAGSVGLELIVPLASTLAIYQQMLELGTAAPDDERHGEPASSAEVQPTLRDMLASRVRLKPAGWHAFNIARIEAGTPLFNIDFGPESLPAETGLMQSRVSLTKGCYLGQEVVARMHARGQAKQQLHAILFESIPCPADAHGISLPKQPTSGMAVFAGVSPSDPSGQPVDAIGVITSSTISPMRAAAPIALAAIKSIAKLAPGHTVCCVVEGSSVTGRVQQSLSFLPQA